MWYPFSCGPPFLKVGAGFCPQIVFGRAGASPHVQTNAMLAPSKDGPFPVPTARSVFLKAGSFRQSGPQRPNVADFSSCGDFPVCLSKAAQRASKGWTEAFVTVVTAVTENSAPVFSVTPVIAVTGRTDNMQLSGIPGPAAGDVDAGFLQAGSMLCNLSGQGAGGYDFACLPFQ